jgi:hypothetical protein
MKLSEIDNQHKNTLHHSERHCAECRGLFIVMMSVVMLIVVMLSVIMLNVVMLSVIAA